MSWRLAGSLVDLRAEVNARWPDRLKASDGTLGDTAHATRTSDHNPDAGGVVRAIDLTAWDPDGPGPDVVVSRTIAEHLRSRRDPRTKYVISEGRMFSSYPTSTSPAWTWRPYSGANGHFHHVHHSVQPGALGDRDGPWGLAAAATNPNPRPEDDPMSALTDDQARKLVADSTIAAMSAVAAVRILERLEGELLAPVGSKGDTRADRIAQLVTELDGNVDEVLERLAALEKGRG